MESESELQKLEERLVDVEREFELLCRRLRAHDVDIGVDDLVTAASAIAVARGDLRRARLGRAAVKHHAP